MRYLWLLVLVAACDNGRPEFVGPESATIGNDQVQVVLRLSAPFGMQIQNAAGRVLLDTLSTDPALENDAVRAYGALGATHSTASIEPAIIEGWDHVSYVEEPWRHGERIASASWDATSAAIDLFDPNEPGTTLHLSVRVEGSEVRIDAHVAAPTDGSEASALDRMGQSFVLPPDEHFFGLGERYDTVDHRGTHYECWTEEGGVGGAEDAPPSANNPAPNGPGMTHVPVPFVLSSRGYGLWMETTYRTGFVLGADDPGYWRIYAAEPALHYRVLVHDDPRATIAHFTALTGRASLPAPWVFGVRHRYDHGKLIGGVPEYQAMRDADLAVTGLDDATHFLPNGPPEDPAQRAAWASEAHRLGYRAIGYFNPYVSTTHPQAVELLAYGREHDLFVRTISGTEFDTAVVSAGAQVVATIDLTNPDAVAWFQSLQQQAIDLGYDGWMLDFAEYIPPSAQMYDGTTGWAAHNLFPVLQARATFELMTRARGNDFLFFARSGYTGSQAFIPVLWSGDPSASFEPARGLGAQVRAALSAGLSGFPFWGSDVGGYTCINAPPVDKELYFRWVEFGALSSDFHDENACAQAPDGFPPKWDMWSDAESTTVFGRYARLHTRLFPYLYAAAQEAQDSGMPIMRHPILVHPNEADAFAVTSEYYFGNAIYVAPVVERGARTRDLWLPPGGWVDWWSLAPVSGGVHVTRDAPLDVLPMFLRAGGVVPMLDPSIDTLAAEADAEIVGLPDVADILDVRAAIDVASARGHAVTVEGASFDVALGAGGALALPGDVPDETDEAQLATCARCGHIEPTSGGAQRVRITLTASPEETVQVGPLTLTHRGPRPLTVRWDVVVIPSP